MLRKYNRFRLIVHILSTYHSTILKRKNIEFLYQIYEFSLFFLRVSDGFYIMAVKGGEAMPGKGNPRISFRVPPNIHTQLRIIAEDLSMSVSELIRDLIDAYLFGK